LHGLTSTAVGRISNRLTSDVSVADQELSYALRAFMATVFSFLTSIGVVLWLVPAFTPAAFVILWCYWRFARGFRSAYRDLRRLEFVAWSPMFSRCAASPSDDPSVLGAQPVRSFGETLHGLVHIRAFGLTRKYQERMFEIIDVRPAYIAACAR
jgi:ABC-type multidrug transport system fused ATPase/permease subunit